MSENCEEKRKRGPNFTANDISLLIDITSRYKKIIENTQSNKVNNKLKDEAWSKIWREYNAAGPTHQRDIEGLKRCYENKKKIAKKKQAQLKREIFKTGGGTPPSPPSPLAEKVLQIINKKKVEGMNNPFGGDVIPKLGHCSEMNPTITKPILENPKPLQLQFPQTQNFIENPPQSPTYGIDVENDFEIIQIMENVADEDNLEELTERPVVGEEYGVAERQGVAGRQGGAGEQIEGAQGGLIGLGARGQVGATERGGRVRGRRPRTYVKALTTSDLSEKYDKLLDKRLEIAEYQKKQLQYNIRMQAEEHQLKQELLQAQIRQINN